jgi:hypothetical protein
MKVTSNSEIELAIGLEPPEMSWSVTTIRAGEGAHLSCRIAVP